MAKWDRKKVGALFKGLTKDDGSLGPDTLIFETDVTFKKGDKLQIETKSFKEQNVNQMVAEGKMTEETAEKARFLISKMSEKIRAEVIKLTKLA